MNYQCYNISGSEYRWLCNLSGQPSAAPFTVSPQLPAPLTAGSGLGPGQCACPLLHIWHPAGENIPWIKVRYSAKCPCTCQLCILVQGRSIGKDIVDGQCRASWCWFSPDVGCEQKESCRWRLGPGRAEWVLWVASSLGRAAAGWQGRCWVLGAHYRVGAPHNTPAQSTREKSVKITSPQVEHRHEKNCCCRWWDVLVKVWK